MILKKKIKVIYNSKGNIIKYISKKNNFLKNIKEVYFTEIKSGYTKGWNKHLKTKCFIMPISGKVKFYLSKNFKKKKTLILSAKKPCALLIKPNIWFAFKSLVPKSVLINTIEVYHDPKETQKKTY